MADVKPFISESTASYEYDVYALDIVVECDNPIIYWEKLSKVYKTNIVRVDGEKKVKG